MLKTTVWRDNHVHRRTLDRRRAAKKAHAKASRGDKGFTLPEILVVLLLVGLAATFSIAAFSTFLRRSEVMMAARLSQKYVYQARMLAVYRGVYHFVVLDPTAQTIGLYEDSSSPFQRFDAGDTKVDLEPWPTSVSLAFPSGASTLPNPNGGAALSSAWSLPLPDSTARWGTTLRGVMTTPNGVIKSAESTPAVISSGAMVFADGTGQTTSVGIRGQMGSAKSYRYDGSAWKVM